MNKSGVISLRRKSKLDRFIVISGMFYNHKMESPGANLKSFMTHLLQVAWKGILSLKYVLLHFSDILFLIKIQFILGDVKVS